MTTQNSQAPPPPGQLRPRIRKVRGAALWVCAHPGRPMLQGSGRTPEAAYLMWKHNWALP
jgi:hypothetical protein